jgi:hypothetical protein
MASFSRPLIRRPLLFVTGLAAAVVGGLLFQPHWVDLCTRINQREFIAWGGQPTLRGGECSPVSPMTMSGNFLIGFGLFMLIIGPIIFSLIHVLRHGYDWESSRVETAVSNLPMLSGILYIAAGAGLAIMGSA